MLAALWLVPLFARSIAQVSLVPLGVPAMLAVFVLILRSAGLGRACRMAFSRKTSVIAAVVRGIPARPQ
jgi:hypothetical protein